MSCATPAVAREEKEEVEIQVPSAIFATKES